MLCLLAPTLLLAAASMSGCEESKACTLMACTEAALATVHMADSDLVGKTHTITVDADGKVLTCTFTYPLATLPSGGTESIACAEGLSVMIESEKSCTETKKGDVIVYSCTGIPGRFIEGITVSGTPKSIHIQHAANGTVILDQMFDPTYTTWRPNGPECEPVCKQAMVEWTLPSQSN